MERIDVLQMNYEKNSVLSKCENVFLEAKRVILNEQLDKIANVTLSEVNNSRKTIENCMKQCKESLNWQNDMFWEELPNPKYPMNKSKNINFDRDSNNGIDIIEDLIKIDRNEQRDLKLEQRDEYLTKKYFLLWKKKIKLQKRKNIFLKNSQEQKQKLEQFLKKVKKYKKQEKNCSKSEEPCKNTNTCLQKASSPQIYKNRYNAQKNIIDMQKTKLEEQNKLIEELKLGIIREDLLKSIDNTKTNIREIFKNCSSNVKCKIPVVVIEETQQFKISTQKAPKIVQHLEKRAMQRAQKRQLILERKRLIEEARQRMLEEAIENKRVMEEEERKKNLEIIKERRKKELEHEKIRQANKQKYLEKLNKAIRFHSKTSKANVLLAEEHYKTKTLKRSINCWCDYVEDTYKLKYEIADAHFTYTILKKTMRVWRGVYVENMRNMQVAEDLFDFRLTSNTFLNWHRYVCFRIIIENKQLKVAENHYRRRLLFHCFFLWRSLPAVIQLEKAKELKKRKWREKVWEVVPDYKPPEDI